MNTASPGVLSYHQRTKHRPDRYAKGPEALDWDDQPNAFRRFSNCETICLPAPGQETACHFSALDTPEIIAKQPLNLKNIGLLLELSFGISAWKQFGPDRWALRCNPSSGNLHPTEAYLLCTDQALLIPGVYHYTSHDHALERRSRFTAEAQATEIFIGLSSVHWREAWKYGERAFRYCQHDIGHALAALAYAASSLGWQVELCSEVADSDLGNWLGLDRLQDFVADERETPDLLCRLHTQAPANNIADTRYLSEITASAFWFGTAVPLNGRHFYRWPIVDEVSGLCQKPPTPAERWQAPTIALPAISRDIPASALIRQRRSAQSFNGKSVVLPLVGFYRMLAALLPNNKPPYTSWNWPADVHLFIFVHRVENLAPGLYFLPRCQEAIPVLKAALSSDFSWKQVSAPFGFYELSTGNFKQAAKSLSCHQAIASDGGFSLGMLSRFSANIEAETWRYRRLFWECGLIGQILYLEAEAAGVRGTGIGCFFDDAVHEVLGINNQEWQSLYHFTVGEPIEDKRLQTLPAYGHLQTTSE